MPRLINEGTSKFTFAGAPGVVGALRSSISEDRSMITFEWTAPFTLLGASEVSYCVDIVSSSFKRYLSKCQLNATEFLYAIPANLVCRVLNFTVVPRNRIRQGPRRTTSIMVTPHAGGIMNAPAVTQIAHVAGRIHIIMVSHLFFVFA